MGNSNVCPKVSPETNLHSVRILFPKDSDAEVMAHSDEDIGEIARHSPARDV
jgi:hypothetical protein